MQEIEPLPQIGTQGFGASDVVVDEFKCFISNTIQGIRS
jgi:hypothetical protein